MKIPSLKGFALVGPKTVADHFNIYDHLDLTKSDLVSRLEQMGSEVLSPQQAAVGAYNDYITQNGRSAKVVLGQYWVLRLPNLSNGRPAFIVHIRETEGDLTAFWHAQNDMMTEGHLAHFSVSRRYQRVVDPEDGHLGWVVTKITHSTFTDLSSILPLVRVPGLLSQCFDMTREMSKWLSTNTRIVNRDREELDTETTRPTVDHMGVNLMYFAMSEELHQAAIDYLNGKGERPINHAERSGSEKLMRELTRQNALATEEHRKLYDHLATILRYIRDQPSPAERPIAISQLVGLQTRWINEVRGLLPPFLLK